MNDAIPYGEGWGWQFKDGRVSGRTGLYHSTLIDGKSVKMVILTKTDFLKIKKECNLTFKSCIPKDKGKLGWTKDHEMIEKTKIEMNEYWDKILNTK